jgi:hypothetical protein
MATTAMVVDTEHARIVSVLPDSMSEYMSGMQKRDTNPMVKTAVGSCIIVPNIRSLEYRMANVLPHIIAKNTPTVKYET